MKANFDSKQNWKPREHYSPSENPTNAGGNIKFCIFKTSEAWRSIPKALKLPFETALFLYAPEKWGTTKKILGALTVGSEIPKSLAILLSNRPLKFFGERWKLINDPFPQDPTLPLTDLDKKIATFEAGRSTSELLSPPVHMTSSSLCEPISTAPTSDIEKITNRNLTIAIDKISYFSIFSAMSSCSGVPEQAEASLASLVDEACRSKNLSPWEIFTHHYKAKMTSWGYFKAAIAYLFLWSWIPIIPRTVDTYLKNTLSALRLNLKENGEMRKKFINDLVENADNFFEVYNGATETYATDTMRKGNLQLYRKDAIDLHLLKENPIEGKTPEELRSDFYHKLSASIVDNLSPKSSSGYLNWGLDLLISRVLRNYVLPEVFRSIMNGGENVTKRHNIPLFLALTKTLTSEISKIRANIGEAPSNSSSLYGIKDFEAVVKKFLRAVDMADCKTVEEVRIKIEQLKTPEGTIDAEIRSGIQLGIQKSLAVVFDYLAKEENTEELFAALFESVSSTLSVGKVPITEKQWAEMGIEYEGAKIHLKQTAAALLKEIAQAAIQEKVRGGIDPELTERTAQELFQEHKTRGLATFSQLSALSNEIGEKIRISQTHSDETLCIRTELSSISSLLKTFENSERVKIAIAQDPPPKLASLPNAEQEAILRVLSPLYQQSNALMDHILSLQTLQKDYTIRCKIQSEFNFIKSLVENIAESPFKMAPDEFSNKIKTALENLSNLDKSLLQDDRNFKEQLDKVSKTLFDLAEEKKCLTALAKLQPFPKAGRKQEPGLIDPLLQAMKGSPPQGFKKWKCLDQIQKCLEEAGFTPIQKKRLLQLVNQISRYNQLPEPRPDFVKEIWEPFKSLLNERKITLESSQKRRLKTLQTTLPRIYNINILEEKKAYSFIESTWKKMNEEGDKLKSKTAKLLHDVERAEKEILYHPSSSELAQVGGTVGFLLGLFSGSIYAPSGSIVGAVAASSIANLENLLKGKWLRFSFKVIASGAAAGVATNYLASYAEDAISKTTNFLFGTTPSSDSNHAAILLGAAGASAGLEYLFGRMTQQIIDSGVSVALPKTAEVFDKVYDNLLMNDVVINGWVKIAMKQIIGLFPPKGK